MNRVFILLPMVLILLACQSPGRTEAPGQRNNSRVLEWHEYPHNPELLRLNGTEARLARKDFSGIELVFYINVENPNDFPIRFPEINWDYFVEGVPLANGIFSGTGVIAAGASLTQDINVNIVYEDIFQRVDSARNAIEANSIFAFDIGTNWSQELQLPIAILHEPEISIQGIRRQSLGRTMVFVFSWEINNINNFDLEIREFDYNIRINNRLWAVDRATNLPRINANSITTVPITITVSEPPIIAELVDILNQGAPVNYNNTGTLSFSIDRLGLDVLNTPLSFQGSTRIR